MAFHVEPARDAVPTTASFSVPPVARNSTFVTPTLSDTFAERGFVPASDALATGTTTVTPVGAALSTVIENGALRPETFPASYATAETEYVAFVSVVVFQVASQP